ncbi:YggT family protein [Candidatus Purcelliella pentastirinorum]|uniref:YggT family protein n=1 Tax=Candidatus Purcelliella pentastirinorum TaxID=472834 RepID=A0AAX3N7G7_9ENTR|nr:YggT family protein [Candidatus Purcelliella pentastirinorum]WDI78552.1 YggT family protein [Candidatus Purcelliella pentastirinorum]WDR80420.1 YggT family protein [Candidatus Purcelliella pentastirinorum]
MLNITETLNSFINFYILIIILRLWMQKFNCDIYNPYSQIVIKLTQQIKKKAEIYISKKKILDNIFILALVILTIIKCYISISTKNLQITIILLSIIVIISLIKSIGYLIFWILITRSLMNIIIKEMNPTYYIIIQLTEPILKKTRKIIPIIYNIDFSTTSIIILIYFINKLGAEIIPKIWNII